MVGGHPGGDHAVDLLLELLLGGRRRRFAQRGAGRGGGADCGEHERGSQQRAAAPRSPAGRLWCRGGVAVHGALPHEIQFMSVIVSSSGWVVRASLCRYQRSWSCPSCGVLSVVGQPPTWRQAPYWVIEPAKYMPSFQ